MLEYQAMLDNKTNSVKLTALPRGIDPVNFFKEQHRLGNKQVIFSDTVMDVMFKIARGIGYKITSVELDDRFIPEDAPIKRIIKKINEGTLEFNRDYFMALIAAGDYTITKAKAKRYNNEICILSNGTIHSDIHLPTSKVHLLEERLTRIVRGNK